MNKKCMMVRDLLDYYGVEGLEGDSLEFVKEHLSTCQECRNYKPSINTIDLMRENEKISEDDKRVLKLVKMLFYTGSFITIVFILWISVWTILWSR